MNITSIKIFCDIVKTRSFSTAAKENNLTQSAASQHISNLEKHLGVALVDRSKRPFQVTREGHIYYEGCKEIIAAYNLIETEVRNLQNELYGPIRISSIYSIDMEDMNYFMNKFMERYPQVDISIKYSQPEKIYNAVLNDEADFGIVSFPEKRSGIMVEQWIEETMCLITPPKHQLSTKSKLKNQDLKNQFFIAFDEDLAIRKEINRYMRRTKTETRIKMAFDNVESIKKAVQIGEGISIVPEPSVYREVKSKRLAAIKLSNPSIFRPLGFIMKDTSIRPNAINKFIDFLRFEEKKIRKKLF